MLVSSLERICTKFYLKSLRNSSAANHQKNLLNYPPSITGCEQVWDSAHVHLQMRRPIRWQTTQADKHHRPFPTLWPGQQVWLSTHDLRLCLPCKELLPKTMGPFTIIKQINSVCYRLQLPPDYCISLTFRASFCKPLVSRCSFPQSPTTSLWFRWWNSTTLAYHCLSHLLLITTLSQYIYLVHSYIPFTLYKVFCLRLKTLLDCFRLLTCDWVYHFLPPCFVFCTCLPCVYVSWFWLLPAWLLH